MHCALAVSCARLILRGFCAALRASVFTCFGSAAWSWLLLLGSRGGVASCSLRSMSSRASSSAPVCLSTKRSARAVVAFSTIVAPWLSSYFSAIRRMVIRCCSTFCQERKVPPSSVFAGCCCVVGCACGAVCSPVFGPACRMDASAAAGGVGGSCSVSAGILLWVKACVCTSDDGSSSVSGCSGGLVRYPTVEESPRRTRADSVFFHGCRKSGGQVKQFE